ncbi:TfoX/Sxy family protein [Stenotrophomonas rhizophila]|uniref:TfoX/Sxy family protein n=1 Tax=Stenotrophomonas rhizophila TaxID=216778 RepID=UPI0010C0E742|nr:TfoX/Sxy family protein [Stenotrophomonas rhizophila]TKK05879.1 transcriptional regulator [Stenotrophomonas rhizophila]
MSTKLRNIGPKSAAWLRQVGLRTPEELTAIGAVGAFVKVRRAGFKPSLNLLYSLEGALQDCHWQELPEARRTELVAEYEAIIADKPLKKAPPASGPVYDRTAERRDDEADIDDVPPFDDETA